MRNNRFIVLNIYDRKLLLFIIIKRVVIMLYITYAPMKKKYIYFFPDVQYVLINANKEEFKSNITLVYRFTVHGLGQIRIK